MTNRTPFAPAFGNGSLFGDSHPGQAPPGPQRAPTLRLADRPITSYSDLHR